MKNQTKIITDNVAYSITLSRRKRTHKMGYNIKPLPRYKQGVRNYYTLYCKLTDWWCGSYSKYSIMNMYKQHINHRFTSPPSSHNQSYDLFVQDRNTEEDFRCDMIAGTLEIPILPPPIR